MQPLMLMDTPQPFEQQDDNRWDNNKLEWLAVELTSGNVIAEFPDLQCNKLSIHMQEITDADATLPWRNIPSNWLKATKPYAMAILLVRDTVVQWGGVIIKRDRTIRGNGLKLSLATIEHYLDSVYINTASYVGMQQTQIVQHLVADNLKDHRIKFNVEAAASVVTRDRNYTSDQDKTVLSALQELSNVINGPEWYTEWRYVDGGYQPYLVTADHVGTLVASTTFDDTVMTTFDVLEDYSSGYGANRVMATSTAEAGERPESPWEDSGDTSRPVIERKFNAGSDISADTNTLTDHAKQELASIQNGTNTISFGVALLNAPQVGLDWQVGDIVGYDVADDLQQYPDYSNGTVRIIGYDISFDGAWTLTPIMQGSSQEVTA